MLLFWTPQFTSEIFWPLGMTYFWRSEKISWNPFNRTDLLISSLWDIKSLKYLLCPFGNISNSSWPSNFHLHRFMVSWITKKLFPIFEKLLHTYLIQGFQKYASNWNLLTAFWAKLNILRRPQKWRNLQTWIYARVSVQGVKSLGGHFACLCQGFEFYEVKKKICHYFSKRKWKYFYTFNHFSSEKCLKRAK